MKIYTTKIKAIIVLQFVFRAMFPYLQMIGIMTNSRYFIAVEEINNNTIFCLKAKALLNKIPVY